MLQLFADRQQELQFLQHHYGTRRAELIVIYGRRRVGKTELSLQFSKNKPHVYFLADRRPETELIQELKQRMSLFLNETSFAKLAVKDWVELFEEFTKWNRSLNTIIILDEFPSLIEANHTVPSIFQKIWDTNLKDTETMLILLGSSISMMETEVLDYKSPLYGRRTAQWKLNPLRIHHLKPFFPDYTLEALVQVYGCLGGIPAYLLKFDPRLDLWQNIERRILTKGEFLYEEAEFLLREELREPRNYSLILKAIAQGANSYGEILTQTKLDKSILSKYTSVMEDLGFIKREYPTGVKPKPRKGSYVITDSYLNFWFRYIFTNRTELEAGDTRSVLTKIKQDYNTYIGHSFEQAVLELLTEMKRRRKLSFIFTTIGKWWHKDSEIDLVAIDDESSTTTFLETKWSTMNKQDSQRILQNLRIKAQLFKGKHKRENYGLIAKKITDKEHLREENHIALDLRDFEPLFRDRAV